ncbi:MAG: hemerythrin domain-containing protein [Alphaproteobacteria bacterium]|nr:hemerythrin domain-containing protein [Alphaproteobacteria bacterium]
MNKRQEARAMAIDTLETMPPVSQLLSPLDYIFADHFRQRVLCRVLDDIADDQAGDKPLVLAALQFLRSEFAPHVIDEEEDLFPLLRRRAEPDDRIEEVLGDLSQEHAADKLDADRIMVGLEQAHQAAGDSGMNDEFRALLHRFAANERRHLIVENAIVMPLARARLTKGDLRSLGRRMAARRGLDFPENNDAV